MNPKPDGSGKYAFTLPMANARLAGIAAHDIGKSAYGVFKEGAPLIGQYVGVSGNLLTGAQMADVLTDVLGVPVYHNSPSFDEYRAYGFPGADDLGNMFQFYHDFETHSPRRAIRPSRAGSIQNSKISAPGPTKIKLAFR
ncbi:MAG: hypothetical protein WDM79_17100 [Terricaulis sp.]